MPNFDPPIMTIKGAKLSFGSNQLFRDVELYINRGDKICLVGRNGPGIRASGYLYSVVGPAYDASGSGYLPVKVAEAPAFSVIDLTRIRARRDNIGPSIRVRIVCIAHAGYAPEVHVLCRMAAGHEDICRIFAPGQGDRAGRGPVDDAGYASDSEDSRVGHLELPGISAVFYPRT